MIYGESTTMDNSNALGVSTVYASVCDERIVVHSCLSKGTSVSREDILRQGLLQRSCTPNRHQQLPKSYTNSSYKEERSFADVTNMSRDKLDEPRSLIKSKYGNLADVLEPYERLVIIRVEERIISENGSVITNDTPNVNIGNCIHEGRLVLEISENKVLWGSGRKLFNAHTTNNMKSNDGLPCPKLTVEDTTAVSVNNTNNNSNNSSHNIINEYYNGAIEEPQLLTREPCLLSSSHCDTHHRSKVSDALTTTIVTGSWSSLHPDTSHPLDTSSYGLYTKHNSSIEELMGRAVHAMSASLEEVEGAMTMSVSSEQCDDNSSSVSSCPSHHSFKPNCTKKTRRKQLAVYQYRDMVEGCIREAATLFEKKFLMKDSSMRRINCPALCTNIAYCSKDACRYESQLTYDPIDNMCGENGVKNRHHKSAIVSEKPGHTTDQSLVPLGLHLLGDVKLPLFSSTVRTITVKHFPYLFQTQSELSIFECRNEKNIFIEGECLLSPDRSCHAPQCHCDIIETVSFLSNRLLYLSTTGRRGLTNQHAHNYRTSSCGNYPYMTETPTIFGAPVDNMKQIDDIQLDCSTQYATSLFPSSLPFTLGSPQLLLHKQTTGGDDDDKSVLSLINNVANMGPCQLLQDRDSSKRVTEYMIPPLVLQRRWLVDAMALLINDSGSWIKMNTTAETDDYVRKLSSSSTAVGYTLNVISEVADMMRTILRPLLMNIEPQYSNKDTVDDSITSFVYDVISDAYVGLTADLESVEGSSENGSVTESSQLSVSFNVLGDTPRGHVLLYLDSSLANTRMLGDSGGYHTSYASPNMGRSSCLVNEFPWEVLDVTYGHSVSRIPSIEWLCRERRHRTTTTALSTTTSPFFIMDTGKGCETTVGRFAPFFARNNWPGGFIVNRNTQEFNIGDEGPTTIVGKRKGSSWQQYVTVGKSLSSTKVQREKVSQLTRSKSNSLKPIIINDISTSDVDDTQQAINDIKPHDDITQTTLYTNHPQPLVSTGTNISSTAKDDVVVYLADHCDSAQCPVLNMYKRYITSDISVGSPTSEDNNSCWRHIYPCDVTLLLHNLNNNIPSCPFDEATPHKYSEINRPTRIDDRSTVVSHSECSNENKCFGRYNKGLYIYAGHGHGETVISSCSISDVLWVGHEVSRDTGHAAHLLSCNGGVGLVPSSHHTFQTNTKAYMLQCPIALFMGCNSAKSVPVPFSLLSNTVKHQHTAPTFISFTHEYLLHGHSPACAGCLWVVTDKQIDLFLRNTLLFLFGVLNGELDEFTKSEGKVEHTRDEMSPQCKRRRKDKIITHYTHRLSKHGIGVHQHASRQTESQSFQQQQLEKAYILYYSRLLRRLSSTHCSLNTSLSLAIAKARRMATLRYATGGAVVLYGDGGERCLFGPTSTNISHGKPVLSSLGHNNNNNNNNNGPCIVRSPPVIGRNGGLFVHIGDGDAF